MTRPDGTQRLCGEYTAEKTLSNLEHIFITRKSWENLGGLPGMYLSIRAAGSPDVTVHGPKVRGGSFSYNVFRPLFLEYIYTVEIRTVEARNSFDFWYMGLWVYLLEIWRKISFRRTNSG